jgi:putative membrane protein
MFRNTMIVSAVALALASPAVAQVSPASTGTATAADTGVSPMTGVSATDYVKLAADSDMYEIQSSRLALTRSKRDDVKSFAREMIADHTLTTKSLMAALKNDDRTIAKPSTRLSAENAAKIALLKKAPKAGFDDLYLQQQAQAHQTAWSLHKGYATDGTDPALKQVASTAVPVIERHLTHAKQMLPAGLAPNQ